MLRSKRRRSHATSTKNAGRGDLIIVPRVGMISRPLWNTLSVSRSIRNGSTMVSVFGEGVDVVVDLIQRVHRIMERIKLDGGYSGEAGR